MFWVACARLEFKSTREALGNVGKIIFWIVVFFLVLLALRLVSVHKTRQDAKDRREEDEARRNATSAKSGRRDETPAQDSMIKCTRCGVFVPKATTVMTSTGLACNDKACGHRR
jgi:hypothetical protein